MAPSPTYTNLPHIPIPLVAPKRTRTTARPRRAARSLSRLWAQGDRLLSGGRRTNGRRLTAPPSLPLDQACGAAGCQAQGRTENNGGRDQGRSPGMHVSRPELSLGAQGVGALRGLALRQAPQGQGWLNQGWEELGQLRGSPPPAH